MLDIWAAGMGIIELLRVKPVTRSEVRTKLFLLFSQPQLRIKETFYSPLQHIQGFASQAYLGQQEPNLGGSGSTSVSVQRFRTWISVVMVKFTSEDLLNPARPSKPCQTCTSYLQHKAMLILLPLVYTLGTMVVIQHSYDLEKT